ncbi:MAG: hypothetical protein IJ874_07250 [Ruminococcus sp.]|nr:hypothetical protein [Ruminococcus sp.]
MKMKNILAAVAASAVSLTALASVSASAAEKTIAYNGASAGAYKVEGTDLRVNIFNEWGNEIRDIDNKVDVSEYINVNFTVSGLNGQTTNKNTDGTDADSYYAWLGGAVGADGGMHDVDTVVANGGTKVDITGDGSYDVKYPVAEPADAILCLYLQTNINVYNREGFANDDPSTTGINIVVNSITTVEPEDPEETTTAAPEETTTAAAGETTTAAAGESTTKAADSKTTTAKADGTTTTAKAAEAAAATGDAGVGIALAAFGVAAGAAFVLRKKD